MGFGRQKRHSATDECAWPLVSPQHWKDLCMRQCAARAPVSLANPLRARTEVTESIKKSDERIRIGPTSAMPSSNARLLRCTAQTVNRTSSFSRHPHISKSYFTSTNRLFTFFTFVYLLFLSLDIAHSQNITECDPATQTFGENDRPFCTLDNCGGQAPEGCWCDPACCTSGRGDCCSNYFQVCFAPTIASVSPQRASTNPVSVVITIFGKFFTTSGSLALGTFTIPEENVVSWSGTEIKFQLPEGYGRNLPVTVTNQWGFVNLVEAPGFSYEVPRLDAVSPTSGPTSGGTQFTIIGSNFGPPSAPLQVLFSGSKQATVLSHTHTTIVAISREGQGLNIPVTVVQNDQTSNTVTWRYSPPSVHSVTPLTTIQASTLLTIRGSSFGTTGAVVRVGASSCRVESQSHDEIRCTAPVGCCQNQILTVTVQGQSSAPFYVGYARPTIFSIEPQLGPTMGTYDPEDPGQWTYVTITGDNFYLTGTVAVGDAVCPTSGFCYIDSWSNNEIIMTLPAGQGASQPVVVTVGDQRSLPATYNYSLPVIKSVNPPMGDTMGGVLITIEGENFGTMNTVTIGGVVCPVSSRIPHTQIVCTLPTGTGANLPVHVIAAGQQSLEPYLWSYFPPTVESVSPNSGSTEGGVEITVTGTSFGNNGVVNLKSIDSPEEEEGYPCIIMTWNQTQITCSVPPGIGQNLAVVVTTGGQRSASDSNLPNEARFSYDLPVISQISPLHGPSAGGNQLVITGTSLGSELLGVTAVVSLVQAGNVALCSIVSHLHNQIICTVPPGIGSEHIVHVEVNGWTATIDPAGSSAGEPFVYSYDLPVIYVISPLVAPSGGGALITISGSSFTTGGSLEMLAPGGGETWGSGEDTIVAVTIAPSDIISWTHSEIVFRLPPGQGANRPIRLTTLPDPSNPSVAPPSFTTGPVEDGGSSPDAVSLLFSYAAPTLSSVSVVSGIAYTSGGATLVLQGSSFGTTPKVYIGDSICEAVPISPDEPEPVSHTRIVCSLPSGQGLARSIFVRAGGQISDSIPFSYADPVITSWEVAEEFMDIGGSGLSVQSGPKTSGSIPITIHGDSFGSISGAAYVDIGGFECPIESLTHNKIVCTLPQWQGRVNVFVTIAADVGEPFAQISNYVTLNYAGPSITGLEGGPFNTAGGDTLTIHGKNFGVSSPTVLVAGKPCAVQSNSHELITCSTPPSEGLALTVTVTAGAVTAFVSGYDTLGPTVTAISGGPFRTQGGDVVTIAGSNFGISAAKVTINGKSCPVVNGSINPSHTELKCTLPAGVGAGLPVVVTILTQASAVNEYSLLSYEPPSITSAGPVIATGPNAGQVGGGSTAGGQLLTIEGSNFGTASLAGLLMSVSVGGKACSTTGPGTSWTHNRIVCSVPSGEGTAKAIRISYGSGLSDFVESSDVFAYGLPSIQSVNPDSIATSGGTITIGGSNFGLTPTVHVLADNNIDVLGVCTIVSRTHSQIVCTAPEGTGKDLGVRVTVGGQTVVFENAFSYNPPTITGVSGAQGPTSGSAVVTLRGASFGSTPGVVTVNGVPALSYITWEHTIVVFVAPEGVGKNVPIVLTTSTGDTFTGTQANGIVFSYHSPTLSSVSGPVPTGWADGEASPSRDITIVGASFSASETAGTPNAVVTVGGKVCYPITSWSHNEIICRAPELTAASAVALPVVVQVAGVSSSSLQFTYAAPILSSFSPPNPPPAGGLTLTIYGISLGTMVSAPTVTIGGRPCPVTLAEHSRAECTLPPGRGSSNAIEYTVAGQSSLAGGSSLSLAYALPTVTSIEPASGPTSGGFLVTVTGTNFGPNSITSTGVAVTIGSQDCSTDGLTHLQDNSHIVCRAPAGSGQDLLVRVFVGDQASPANPEPEEAVYFSYTTPHIDELTPSSVRTSGLVPLTISGSSFGSSAAVVKVTIGGAICSVASVSDEEVVCTVPPSEGGDAAEVLVHVGNLQSNAAYLTFMPPQIDAISPTTGPTSGGTILLVTGSSFGTGGTVTIGGKICSVVPGTYTHTSVRCVLPAGGGEDLSVRLITSRNLDSNEASNEAPKFTYNPPTITSISPPSGPTSGILTNGAIALLTITGTNFASEGSVTVGGQECVVNFAGGAWSDTRIVCTIPEGTGVERPVLVYVSTYSDSTVLPKPDPRVTAVPKFFDYQEPVLTSWLPGPGEGEESQSLTTEGGHAITVVGRNLGAVLEDLQITIDGRGCTLLEWITPHERLTCLTPPGAGSNLPFAVTLNGRAGNSTMTSNFVYARPKVTSVASPSCVNLANVATDCGVDLPQHILTITGTSFGRAEDAAVNSIQVTVGEVVCQDPTIVVDHTQLTCTLPTVTAGQLMPVHVTVRGVQTATGFPGVSYAGPKITEGTLVLVSPGDDPMGPLEISTDGGVYTAQSVPLSMIRKLQRTLTRSVQRSKSYLLMKRDASGFIASSFGAGFSALDTSVNLELSHTFGGQKIGFQGSSFGHDPSKVRVYFGETSSPRRYECAVDINNSGDDYIVCTVPSGVGKDLHLTVEVTVDGLGTQISAPSADTVSYPNPTILAGTIRSQSANVRSTSLIGTVSQGQHILFDVEHVGLDASKLVVTYAPNDPEHGSAISSLTCSNPAIVLDEQDHLPLTQRTISILCLTQANPGYVGPYVFTVRALNAVSGPGTDMYTYPIPPTIRSVTGCAGSSEAPRDSTVGAGDDPGLQTYDCPTAGGIPITIEGTNFDTLDVSVKVGSQDCPVVSATETTLVCTLPRGVGANLAVVVTVGAYFSPSRNMLSYAAPVLSTITGCPSSAPSGSELPGTAECPRTGGITLTLTGREFGLSGARILVGDIIASNVQHAPLSPETELTFTLPAGFGSQIDVTVLQANGQASSGVTISYAACPAGTHESTSDASCTPCSQGTFSATSGQFACTPCPAGTYQPDTGKSSCLPCATGKHQLQSGQTDCEVCADGYFAPSSGLAECRPCEAGRYATGASAAQHVSCLQCPAGKYSESPAASTGCVECSAGYISRPGAASCTPCPAGTFAQEPGLDACEPCAFGYAQPLPGQAACEPCEAGQYGPERGLASCIPCPSGTQSASSGAVACDVCDAGAYSKKVEGVFGPTECPACPAGSYTPVTAQQSCLQCPPGSFTGSSGQSECTPCPKGKFSGGNGASRCLACAPGKFADSEGTRACIACDVGTYSAALEPTPDDPEPGIEACTPCEPGKYQDATEQSTCKSCPAGRANAQAGQSQCPICLSGTYTDEPGQLECQACEKGRYSIQSSTTIGPTACVDCDPGRFAPTERQRSCGSCPAGQYAPDSKSHECLICPAGKYSTGGASVCDTCEAGFFSTGGSTGCIACSAGSYAPEDGHPLTCQLCEVGKFARDPQSKSCQSCLPGSYAPQLGLSFCYACPVGRFSKDPGSSACLPCQEGKYNPEPGRSVCESCPAGTYAEHTGQVACAPCPTGEFSEIEGMSRCEVCAAGKSAGLASDQCASCEPGTFAPRDKSMQCTQCPPGTFQPDPSSSNCVPCPRGTFSAIFAAESCEPCEAGQYAPELGSRSCTACPAGRFAPSPGAVGASSCSACAAGRFASQPGLAACADCEPGKYSPEGSVSCLDCPIGTEQPEYGKGSCSPCRAGSAQASIGQPNCEPCSVGRYTAVEGQALCILCPTGRYASEPGRSSCTQCEPNTYSISTVTPTMEACVPCPEGSYQPTPGQGSCIACPPGTKGVKDAITGATDCVPCDPGTFQGESGQTDCDPCPEGHYAPDSGSVVCLRCAKGSVSTGGAAICTLCEPGSFADEAGSSACETCAPGTVTTLPGQSSCVPCSLGTFDDTTRPKRDTCIACPLGKYNNEPGQTRCKDCDPGKYTTRIGQISCIDCPPGTYSSVAGVIDCTPCEAGKYASTPGQKACTACDSGRFAAGEGSLSCVDCPAGRYAGSPQSSACAECEVGKYSALPKQVACELCPAGTYTSTKGLTVCIACAAGSFSAVADSAECELCPPGKYQPLPNQSRCEDCAPGTFTSVAGALQCTACAPGTITNGFGKSECTPCDEGHFAPDNGMSACEECRAGFYGPQSGLRSCLPCPSGYYAPDTGATECLMCQPGTYSVQPAEGGITECLPCLAGKYQPNEAQELCLDCPVGRATALEAQAECQACNPGEYNGVPGATSCKPCEEGHYTDKTEAVSCVACPVGKYGNDTGQSVCTDCEPGRYRAVTGSTYCEFCGPGSFQPQGGMYDCLPCPVGKYINQVENTACRDCEPGRFANNPSSRDCTDCSPGYFQSAEGQSNCNPCQPGTFGKWSGLTACEACAEGTYSSTSAQSTCEICGVGRYSSAPGQVTCAPCPAGRYNDLLQQSECFACESGYHQSELESTTCEICPAGRFSQLGATDCSPCPEGAIASKPGSGSCEACDLSISTASRFSTECICNPGYYFPDMPDYTGPDRCLECIQGADCRESGARWQTLAALPGWWRPSTSSSAFYRCTLPSNCPGGEAAASTYGANSGSPCSANREGALCLVCAPGYKTGVDGSCEPCPKGEGAWIVTIIVLLCVAILVAISVYFLIRSGDEMVRQVELSKEEANQRKLMYRQSGVHVSDKVAGGRVARLDKLSAVLQQSKQSKEDAGKPSAKATNPKIASRRTSLAIADEDVQVGLTNVHDDDDEMEADLPDDDDSISDVTDTEDELEMEAKFNSTDGAISGNKAATREERREWRRRRLERRAQRRIAAGLPPFDPDEPSTDEESDLDASDGDQGYSAAASSRVDGGVMTSVPLNSYGMPLFPADLPDPYSDEIWKREHPPLTRRRREDSIAYKIKIFISFLQIATNIGTNLEIQWPNAYKKFVLFFDFTNVDYVLSSLTSAECYDSVDYYTKFVVTAAFPPVVLALIAVLWILPREASFVCFRQLSPQAKLRSRMRTWIIILYFIFLIYPSVSSMALSHFACKDIDDGHTVYSLLLADVRQRCYDSRWNTYAFVAVACILVYPIGIPLFYFYLLWARRNRLFTDGAVQATFGFLYMGYQDNRWWWEIVDLLHKLIQTSIIVLLPLGTRLPVGMGAAVIYLVLILLFSPHISKENDVFSLVCQNLIFLMMLAGYFFYRMDYATLTDSEDIGMSIALFVATAIFVIIFFYLAIQAIYRGILFLRNKYCPSEAKNEDGTPRVDVETVMAQFDLNVNLSKKNGDTARDAVGPN